MLFNSPIFLFLFLPATLAACRLYRRHAFWIVLIASFGFYGYAEPKALLLLGLSIAINHRLICALSQTSLAKRRKFLLALGLAFNLGLLAYFKYARFFLSNLRLFLPQLPANFDIVLPVGISFFTFQQVSYLVDAYRGAAKTSPLAIHALFIAFFPHLIAGPIVRHDELLPQLSKRRFGRPNALALAQGLTVFACGLFKKTVLADSLAPYADAVFQAAATHGIALTFFEAWGGALCYALQIYFDFSGYSDMAIGLARFFNVRFPANFSSPYKAIDLVDFWRRWHITLSHFLRDYVYVPLGGNRKGTPRRYLNLLLTMLVGGFWHGANWTFIVWGGAHGILLACNHATKSLLKTIAPGRHLPRAFTWPRRMATFLVVTTIWVPFRATTFKEAAKVLTGMSGLNGYVLPGYYEGVLGAKAALLKTCGITFGSAPQFDKKMVYAIVIGLGVVWFLPHIHELMARLGPTIHAFRMQKRRDKFAWSMNPSWAIVAGILLALGILAITRQSPFLYFRF